MAPPKSQRLLLKPTSPTLSKPDKQSELLGILKLIPGYDANKDASDFTFNKKSASDAIRFFEHALTHAKGKWSGKPFTLEPWQKAIVANIFGWKRKDGNRRYREVFIMVPRKNGKSLMAAGILLTVMFTDGEQGAELYCAAAEREQAALVFSAAKTMIANKELLRNSCEVFKHAITIEKIGASMRPISAEAYSKHGYNAHCIVVDELHAQKNRELVDVLETSTGSRAQPLIVHITTSDYNRPSICNEKYEYAVKVRDGLIDDPSFLPVIYEAKLEDDWTSPEVWKKANPNYGVSLSQEYMESKCKKAQEEPSFTNTFKRLHLNIKTDQNVLWIPVEHWDECKTKILKVEDLIGEYCCAGLDLASTTDIAAFAMYFPKHHCVLPKFWVPENTVESRSRKGRVPYNQWVNQKFIETTPGDVIDYEFIRAAINQLAKLYSISEIGVDPWNSRQLQAQLKDQDGLKVVEYGQGFASMTSACKEYERLIVSKQLQHFGDPVMRWMMSNVSVQMDPAGNIKPARDKSTGKIDGVVAAVMAIGCSLTQSGPGSVYEERGILTL